MSLGQVVLCVGGKVRNAMNVYDVPKRYLKAWSIYIGLPGVNFRQKLNFYNYSGISGNFC